MGNTDQTLLGVSLLYDSEHESAKLFIVFYVAENTFNLSGTFGAQTDPFFRGRIGSGTLPISQQTKTDADRAILFGFRTLGSERTSLAIRALVIAPVREIPVLVLVASGIQKIEQLMLKSLKNLPKMIISALFNDEEKINICFDMEQ